MSTWIEILLGSLGAIVVSLIAVIYYTMQDRIKTLESQILEIDDKMEQTVKEMAEIKINYLDRFKELNQNLVDTKIDIIKELHKLTIQIIESQQNHGKNDSNPI